MIQAASLLTKSADTGRILLRQQELTLRVQGYSMYPTLRHGDRIHLTPCSVAGADVGSLAVCRIDKRLYCHRIVEKTSINGQPCIITQADAGDGQGCDAPVFSRDLLGVVTAVGRRGKLSPPRERSSCQLRLRPLLHPWLTRILAWVAQKGRAIPLVAARQRKKNRVSFVVQLPLSRQYDLFRSVPPEEFDLACPTWQGRKPDCWNLALHVNGEQQAAALIFFSCYVPDNGQPRWQIDQLHIRIRYQGLGLQQELLNRAAEIFRRNNLALPGMPGEL